MTPVVSTRALCRAFGAVQALSSVKLDAAEGEILALAGPNAAGKTTLLRLLAGLLEATAGEVCVLGQPPRQALGEVCYVGDGWELPPWMTVGLMARLQADAARCFSFDVFRSLCHSHGIGEVDVYQRLSKGNRKWVLFALAIATPCKLLLLDEPADGLDPVARRDLYGLVRRQVLDHGTSVIVSTHILSDVERLADSIALLHRGRIVLRAELETLREEVRLVETPAGVPLHLPADAIECLRTTLSGEQRLTWLRASPQALEALTRELGPRAVVRPMDLESLFIAMFEEFNLCKEAR